MKSAIYSGRVRHRRFELRNHTFSYPLYMMALDLDELDMVVPLLGQSRWPALRWMRSDYLSARPEAKLKEAATKQISELGGDIAVDRIVLVCQLRCFGLYFSPINTYFAYQRDRAVYMLAEVSNTPWGETHYYLVDLINPQTTPKAFHVSPFMAMNMHYRWRIKPPAESLCIHIESWREQLLFDATLVLKRRELNPSNIKMLLKKWPMMTLNIVRGIYWQAFKLFAKGIPFHSHPGRS